MMKIKRTLEGKEAAKIELEEKINKAVEDKQLIIRYIEEIQQKRESLDKIIAGWQTTSMSLS